MDGYEIDDGTGPDDGIHDPGDAPETDPDPLHISSPSGDLIGEPARQTLWDAVLADPDMAPHDKWYWLAICLQHVSKLIEQHPPAANLDAAAPIINLLGEWAVNPAVDADPLLAGLVIELIAAECRFLWRLLPAEIRQDDQDQFVDLLTHFALTAEGVACPNCGWRPGQPIRRKPGRPKGSKTKTQPVPGDHANAGGSIVAQGEPDAELLAKGDDTDYRELQERHRAQLERVEAEIRRVSPFDGPGRSAREAPPFA